MAWGDGDPGPLDVEGARFDPVEAWLAAGNGRFADRLAELGLPATIDAYGPGTHTWRYWERGLERALPVLLLSLRVSAAPGWWAHGAVLSSPSPFSPAAEATTPCHARVGQTRWEESIR